MPALFPLYSAATVDFVLRGRWAAPDLSVDDTHDFNGGYKLPFLSPLMLRLISFAGFLLSVFAFRVQVVVLFIVFCSSWMFTMYITNFELWPSAMGSQFNVSHSKSWVQRNLWPSIIVWRWAFVTECLCQVVLRHALRRKFTIIGSGSLRHYFMVHVWRRFVYTNAFRWFVLASSHPSEVLYMMHVQGWACVL